MNTLEKPKCTPVSFREEEIGERLLIHKPQGEHVEQKAF